MTVTLQDLSVSDVSGMVAVGIAASKFLLIVIDMCKSSRSLSVQIFIPFALPIILLGFFKRSPTTLSASTWSISTA